MKDSIQFLKPVRPGLAVCLASGLMLAAYPAASQEEHAPKHEVGLTLGSMLTTDLQAPQNRIELGSGIAFQANYGYRFFEADQAALYGEVHLLASPQRLVASPVPTLTRDIATLYVTPGVRLKFFPRSALAPYVVAGGGYALYEQSLTRLDGQPNSVPRTINRGVFHFGGGVDLKLWRFVGLRAEFRDFYSGSPAYNSAAVSGGQHNLVASGGIVLKFQ